MVSENKKKLKKEGTFAEASFRMLGQKRSTSFWEVLLTASGNPVRNSEICLKILLSAYSSVLQIIASAVPLLQ